jgi:hypothetical protein
MSSDFIIYNPALRAILEHRRILVDRDAAQAAAAQRVAQQPAQRTGGVDPGLGAQGKDDQRLIDHRHFAE